MYSFQIMLIVLFSLTTIKFFVWDLHEDRTFNDNKPQSIACFLVMFFLFLFFEVKAGWYSTLTNTEPQTWAQIVCCLVILMNLAVAAAKEKWINLAVNLITIPFMIGAGGVSQLF